MSILGLTELGHLYMLRLLFGFWFLSSVRTKEQRRQDNIKRLIPMLLILAITSWFRLNPPTDTVPTPKQSTEYITNDGHTIVYDHKQDKYILGH